LWSNSSHFARRVALVFARCLGVAVAGLVLLEGVARGDVGEAARWLVADFRVTAVNLVLLGTLGAVAVGLFGRPLLAGVLLTAPLAVLALVHRTKLQLLGSPLYPWDFLLHREAVDLLPQVWRHAGLGVVVGAVGAVVALVVVAARVRVPGPRLVARLALLGVGVAALAAGLPGLKQRLVVFGVQHRTWLQTENSSVNGLLLAFAFNLDAVAVQRPPGYGAPAVHRALEAVPPRPHVEKPEEPMSLVVVMSESFFDPTRLPGVEFTADPVPTVRRLQREAASGTLMPPVFGGGTANTEFEVLTGHTMRFLPAGSVPYQQYLRRQHDSLASIYANAGYETVAVHTYHRWFWEREAVYRHLGFQRFVGLEDIDDAPLDGMYVSDSVLTREIIREFEASRGPVFLFAVSMEAHGPYRPGRYPDSTLDVRGPLDEVARGSLLTYAEAVRHADRELDALLAYFSRVERPVTVVFFGDHLPTLPEVLRQTGVIESIHLRESVSLETRRFLHEVPLVAWSNQGRLPSELGVLSANHLGPMLLELTGTPGTAYSDYVANLRARYPVVLPGLVADAEGRFGEALPAELEREWWTLQYDALFGEDFARAAPSSG
jgi:phosphoglycerol transferase MdoB-like AlkP superfamily enzyme